jgi:hypothetical protein
LLIAGGLADRFPRIVKAVESLPVQSCFIDGEAVVVDHTIWQCAITVRGQCNYAVASIRSPRILLNKAPRGYSESKAL